MARGASLRRMLLPFVIGAVVAGAVASLAGAPEIGELVWSVATGVVVTSTEWDAARSKSR